MEKEKIEIHSYLNRVSRCKDLKFPLRLRLDYGFIDLFFFSWKYALSCSTNHLKLKITVFFAR